ncbi:MAG TPA: dTDP-4-dehydrorhamnose 3,5-epimerase [Blastocatellia bacterium]|jgi:dTDP-4-dehydrorhamnose 3,5-epimerase
MRRIETDISGMCVLEPKLFSDERGFFMETYNESVFRSLGITGSFVQDNHSCSVKGTLRGLHYQLKHAQAKLCRVVRGEVMDVAVDIRRGSPTFGRHFALRLSSENKLQLYIPPGLAHGFLVLSDSAEFLYKCSDFYHPEDEYGIAWNDPEIGIEWPINEPILSVKDQRNLFLSAVPIDRLPEMK